MVFFLSLFVFAGREQGTNWIFFLLDRRNEGINIAIVISIRI